MAERVCVIGLGYVGLPVALAFAEKFPETIGFDVDALKVAEIARGHDRNREIPEGVLRTTSLVVSSDPAAIAHATLYVVAVPTPVDEHNVPDLRPVLRATETVAKHLVAGDLVVYESTVYPGVTEDVCGPLLARLSGLAQGRDFSLGYSPERINPGDKEHTLTRIVKVVAGDTPRSLERVAAAYGAIIEAGIHRAPSIKVAEAAKAIENTQRDINIALMNELAIIFDRIGIRTADVIAAAATKWNFLGFRPGLVGGHCIGVDPYYLTTMAVKVGHHPEVILAGRRINDGMGRFVAQRLVKLLVNADVPVRGARVGVLGLTFKEDVSDLRNSKVVDIVSELREFGVEVLVHDPIANPDAAQHEYGLALSPLDRLRDLDGVVLAVNHAAYRDAGAITLAAMLKDGGVFVDVKSAFAPETFAPRVRYWSL